MKQKRYLSRREKTVRRIEALLLLLALFAVSGIYSVLPSHAIREAETCVDCGPTTILRRLGSAEIRYDGLNRLYVSANNKALLFTAAQFSPWEGWQEDSPGAVDCTRDRPLHAGIYMAAAEWQVRSEIEWDRFDDNTEWLLQSYHYDRVYYAYGRVDDTNAALVRILVGYEDETGWVTLWSTEIPRNKWFWEDGHRYFVEKIFQGGWIVEDSDYEGRITFRAELLDDRGDLLYLDEELTNAATRLSPVPLPEE